LRSAQALAAKLKQGKLPDKFTARDVQRNRWRYLASKQAVSAALDWLEDEHWIRGYRDKHKAPVKVRGATSLTHNCKKCLNKALTMPMLAISAPLMTVMSATHLSICQILATLKTYEMLIWGADNADISAKYSLMAVMAATHMSIFYLLRLRLWPTG
jgi:hypothetical protein